MTKRVTTKSAASVIAGATMVAVVALGLAPVHANETAQGGVPVKQGKETRTIAEVVTQDKDLSMLRSALESTDLIGMFDACNDAKTTVFAPTNAAFTAAFKRLGVTAEDMLDDHTVLVEILTNHVSSGSSEAAAMADTGWFHTLNGEKVSVAAKNGSMVLNGSVRVVAADIKACNGVVDVIDTVLAPKSFVAPSDNQPGKRPAAESGTASTVAASDAETFPVTGMSTSMVLVWIAGGMFVLGGLTTLGARRPARRNP